MKKVFTLLTASLFFTVTFSQNTHTPDPFVKTFIQNTAAQPDQSLQAELRNEASWVNFKQQHGDWWVEFNEKTTTPHRAFGKPIQASGATPEEMAYNFIMNDLNVFGTSQVDFDIRGNNTSKYHYITYVQEYNGIEVLWSEATVRLSLDGNIVMFGLDIYPQITLSTTPSLTPEAAQNFAKTGIDITINSTEGNALKILPIPGEGKMEYKLVYETFVHTINAENIPGNYYTLVDANNGTVYYRQNRVHACGEYLMSADIQVNSDISDNPLVPLVNRGLPYLKIDIDGDTHYTDANGFLSLNSISDPTPATIDLSGLYAKVYQGAGGASMETIDVMINPGTNTIEFDDESGALASEVSAYYWQNIVHDHMKAYFPAFTDLDFDQLIRVERNDGTCNAFYDGASTNFYEAGDGCPATALFNDVVMHEYGHGVNYDLYNWLGDAGGGMNNGAMQEGYADLWGITVTDNPIMGQGFFGGAGTSVRRYDEDPKVYPVDLVGEVHADGEIIAGAWWDVKENFDDMVITTELWMETHNATVDGPDGDEGSIFRDVLLEALIADDDNADLLDGTPNDDIITEAFCEHGITLVGNITLEFDEFTEPVTEMEPITLEVELDVDYPEYLGAANVFWRTTPGAAYTISEMTDIGGDTYQFDIPAQPQGTIVEYYFKIEDNNGCGGTVLPEKADLAVEPNLPFFTIVGFELVEYEDFDVEFGSWIVDPFGTDDASTGIWDVNTPLSSTDETGYQVQTDEDHTDGDGNLCAFTGNAGEFEGVGTNDVDGGMTTLRSPFFDVTEYTDPVFSYWRIYSNASPTSANPGNDTWEAYITDNGTDWVRIERTHTEDNSWRRNVIRVSDYVELTDQVGFIFVAEDSILDPDEPDPLAAGGSLVEAAIDDLYLYDWAKIDTTEDTTGQQAIDEDFIISGIFPNPADAYINIYFGAVTGEVEITLFSHVGALLLNERIIVGVNNQYRIETAQLPEGIYMLSCKNNGSMSNRQLIIQH